MLNIDIRLQTRRHSEAQIAVLAIKPHVGWDEKACRELYQREREQMNVERSREKWMRENEGTTTCFEIFFCASISSIVLAKVGYGCYSTHTNIYIYIYIRLSQEGQAFFESIYIYILQRIKTEK